MTSDVHDPPLIRPGGPGPAARSPRRIPRRGWVILGALLAGALGIAAVEWGHRRHASRGGAAPAPQKVTVTTAAARSGDIGVYLQAIGTVTPVHTAAITSQVTGAIEAVHYREGQRVERGDPLIDLDSRPYRANLLQAQGALERDEHLLAQARMDLERYRNAWARNAIARQTLDDQEKVVLQAMGTVKNDRGTVAYEQVQVDFCHIRAPFAGRVGLRLLDPGNLVQATGNVTLAVVMQLEPITVVFTISQANLDEVRSRLAQDAELAVDAFDQAGQRKLAGGALVTIDNQLDTTTGTVKARAQFENADDALFPNQFVNTRLLVDTHRGVTLVPSTAVQQNGTSSFVYVVDGGVAHMRNVTPVVSEAGTTELRGIDAGALVATSGFDRLRDGGPVVTAVAPAPRDDGDGGP